MARAESFVFERGLATRRMRSALGAHLVDGNREPPRAAPLLTSARGA